MAHEMHHADEHYNAEPKALETPEGPVLTLTEVAVEKIKEVMEREGLKQGGLRVSVVGGGCSGFQYNLALDENSREDDTIVEQGGVKVFVDSMSGQYLSGVVIDYVNGLHGAGFRFINPHATRTCGCGSSFAA